MAKKKVDSSDDTSKGEINFEFNQGVTGLNMDNIPSQVDKGSLTYALNAALENFDSNSVTYQNEPGTEFCLNFPHNYIVVGRHLIPEKSKKIFMLANPITGGSEIGYVDNNNCEYKTLVNDPCLAFDVNHPIHKIVHKTNNCGTEIYWAQSNQDRRYLNIDKIPYLANEGSTPCDKSLTGMLDCNQLRVQPNYGIPGVIVKDVIIGGNLISGTYQFAFQYSDAGGNPLSSYHSVTNPTPIADISLTTVNFNYPVGKAIVVGIEGMETGGQFAYFNLAVIKTINNITSVELVGTYPIEGEDKEITYTGQNVTQIRLTVNDIFEKFPVYGPADDVTTAQDVLIWKGLSAPQRVNYQKIANEINLLWETWRIPAGENYADEMNATHLRGYLRDEVYPFEIVFLLTGGRQTDGFHIPGRALTANEASFAPIDPSNNDFIEDPTLGPQPYWKIYNTAQNLGFSPDYKGGNPDYKGPYQIGSFAYWESTDTYSCDKEMWGDLAEQPIRHHKFPDVEVSPIFETKQLGTISTSVGEESVAPNIIGGGDWGNILGLNPSTQFLNTGNQVALKKLEMGNVAIFPIGVRVDTDKIKFLIESSDLTSEQKADIVGYKIVRGDRTDNRSIVAKGMLRNVNSYIRDEQTFYYPNYPYNDLNPDAFINSSNNAYQQIAKTWLVICSSSGTYQFGDPNTSKTSTATMVAGETYEICSTTRPIYLTGKATIGPAEYDVYYTSSTGCRGFHSKWKDPFSDDNTEGVSHSTWLAAGVNGFGAGDVFSRVAVGDKPDNGECNTEILICPCGFRVEQMPNTTQDLGDIDLDGGGTNDPHIGRRTSRNCLGDQPIASPLSNTKLAYRQIFNSPETSFGQPFIGDVLKLESVIFGGGLAHFVAVKDNAKYRLLTKEAQQDALKSAGDVGKGDAAATFAAYQAYLEIYINGITRKNYAYSFNSIADYNYSVPVPDERGIKQRRIDLKKYLIPYVQAVGEKEGDINNYQRETSVYLRTEGLDDNSPTPLPYPHLSPNMSSLGVRDISRFTIGCNGAPTCIIPGTTTTTTTLNAPIICGSCSAPEQKRSINVVSYYASIKNTFRNQWGQMYSYQTIDTGYQVNFDNDKPATTIFGGDTFICRFAYKTKLPFFIDNRVGAPDDSEIFYDEIGNIGYPKFWHSARSILENFFVPGLGNMTNIITYKAHNFDCPNCQWPGPPDANPSRTYYDGYFYLFAYGIPNFYVETSYNIDLRQAFNNKEGDFWPHVSNSIPDDWLQESWVSILNDNTYNYNVTFSKQNKETFFSHIPPGFDFSQDCQYIYPFRAIFSDPQLATTNTLVNNWLTYRANAYFDFPQNYGKLTSLDGIDNRQVLARFENKSLLYNALYTTQTDTGGQVYLGQSLFSKTAPPLDFGETDLGYVGSQHKFLLKIPQGVISIDAKRGQVFLLGGQAEAKDLSAPGSGMNRFFTDHLAFEILKYFPEANIDNNFNGLGLHGVYDSKYDRVIITKLDYVPLSTDIKYDSALQEFYKETLVGKHIIRNQVFLSDGENFCNKSWTLSLSFVTNSWISFHSYLPNWYLGENNFFYSGKKGCCNEFDFEVILGELVPNPSTTTSTTTYPVPPSTTSTTTIPLACTMVGGTVTILNCDLAGTAVITVAPVPPPCQRPSSVITNYFATGYTITTPPSTVVSTGSQTDACNAVTYYNTTDRSTFAVNSITVQYVSLNINSIIFLGNGTDCTVAPDGWYWTDQSSLDNTVYSIVGGKIAQVIQCSPTTTTTTTCNLYLYDVEFFTCSTCTFTGKGTIGNSQALTVDKFYYDPVTKFKMKIVCNKGCGTGTDRSIDPASVKDNCPAVICPVATTTSTTTI